VNRLARLAGRIRLLRESQVRVRVTLAATVVALLGAAIGSTIFVISLRQSLQESLAASAEQQAATVVAQLKRGTAPSSAVVGTIDDVTTQILDSSGTLVASDRARPIKPLRTTPGTSRGVHVRGLHDAYVVVAKRTDTGLLVVVGKSEEEVQSATATAVGLLLVAVPVGIALLAAVIWISVGRALRPVEGMRREATTITSEHLHRRLQVPTGKDEISFLASTLNEMLDRIDSAQRLQRQFISDASHELRSPLASVRQLTEVAERFPDSTSTQELAHEIRAEERRMEDLVTALLTLARLDNASVGNPGSVVDLDDIIVEQLTRARETDSPVQLSVGSVTPAAVRGNPILVAQLVQNLLSNAIRHAKGRVQVSLESDEDTATLCVDDDGEGIAPADREQVFERFVRLDEARHRDSGGSGLGLSIVRKVTAASGGDVVVEESPFGGARLKVTFPLT
jgi:signal transduction histidine kinase